MLRLAIIVTLLSVLIFTITYLYFLGLRFIRENNSHEFNAVFPGCVVLFGILTATVSLEAAALIAIVRNVSGQLFFVAAILGAITAMLATAGKVSKNLPKPIRVALVQRKVAIWGLIIGNTSLVIINVLCFLNVLPSVL